MESDISKIKNDYLYNRFGIIPNQVYKFELEDCTTIHGIIINFDANQFCVKGNRGLYIISRPDIKSLYPIEINQSKWEKSCLESLKDVIDKQNSCT